MHTYIHTYTHTYIPTYIHIHTYIHTYIHIYIHTYIHTYTHTYIHRHTYLHTCIHTHTYIYTYTYIHTRAYLHRFKILEHATCPCGNESQTVEHILERCPILNTQWELLKRNIQKTGNWPANKQELISNHLKSFLLFLKSINFDRL